MIFKNLLSRLHRVNYVLDGNPSEDGVTIAVQIFCDLEKIEVMVIELWHV